MRTPVAILLLAALLAGCAAMDVPAGPARFTAAPLPASLPSDLPRGARPLHYAITVQPDAQALTFAGQSVVTLELYRPASDLVLNALGLDISEAELVAADGARVALSVTYQPEEQTARFTAARRIEPGTYRLETRYTGTINTQPVGLFALDYPAKQTGQQERGLFTQFEASDARRFAPMFDEPSYKATFDLSVIVPEAQLAVSNMPVLRETALGAGRKQVSFATTPQMSSYLLFFAAGDFERITARAADGTELGIVAPAGSGEQARFALDSLTPLVPWLEDYFGTQYPLPKLDNVTAPGQSQFFDAMENWGAILTFEHVLLEDPAITSPLRRQQIYVTQAHEVAHQWFGNSVTMAWWDDLWLNEGFASWLENKVTHHFHPEWQQNLSRVDVREAAMSQDGYANTHAVIREVRSVAELDQVFDTIAYSKGESVVAMLEDFAGQQVWQDGLRRYLAGHAFGNTSSADLWRAMEEAGATGLTGIAQDFTTQPGVPLVRATGACVGGQTRLTFSQSEFSRDRREQVAAAPHAWRVPVWIAAGQGVRRGQVLEGSGAAVIDGCAAPVLINAGQTGYFRTLYSDELAARQQAGFAQLAPIDQLGLLRDAFALAEADYQPLSRALALLEAVPIDANPLVAGVAASSWADQYDKLTLDHAAERAQVAALAQRALGPRLAALGFEPVSGEQVVDSNLRAALIDALGRMGDERVLAQAHRRFALLAEDPRALDGPLKPTWLAIASAGANAQEWEMLLRLARASASTGERQKYFEALGAARDPVLAQRALDFAMTGEAQTVSAEIIDRVSLLHPELAFDFANARMEAVRALVDPSMWQEYLAWLPATSGDPAMIARLETIRDAVPADEAVPYTRAIDAMRVRLETAPLQERALLEWLSARA